MVDHSYNPIQRSWEKIHEPLSSFIRAQTTTSWFLFLATLIALFWANSDASADYQHLTHTQLGLVLGDFSVKTTLKHFINDGLMVLFFFMLGLEVKLEVLAGDLSLPESRRMLILCALGGMILPAAIYLAFNWSLDSQIGWGIPMATDSAFALGVLALIKRHIPSGLLAFLVGLAIVDDIGAILVIAIFYAENVSIGYLMLAFGLIGLLALGNYAGIRQPLFYLLTGIACWVMMLKSGVHATFAGVAIALTIPAKPKIASKKLIDQAKSVLRKLDKKPNPIDVLSSRKDHERVINVRDAAQSASTPLRRWQDAMELPVNLMILPLFVLVNAGVPFNMASIAESFYHPVGLGIILGLFFGKLIGISGLCWFGLRFQLGQLPASVTLKHVVGLSLVAGIGFTMSTFIATLGFETQPQHLQGAKSAILIASILSAACGIFYLRFMTQKPYDEPSQNVTN